MKNVGQIVSKEKCKLGLIMNVRLSWARMLLQAVVIAGSIKRLTMGMLKCRYPLVRVPLHTLCVASGLDQIRYYVFGVPLNGAEIGQYHRHQTPKLLEISWLGCVVRNGDVIKMHFTTLVS